MCQTCRQRPTPAADRVGAEHNMPAAGLLSVTNTWFKEAHSLPQGLTHLIMGWWLVLSNALHPFTQILPGSHPCSHVSTWSHVMLAAWTSKLPRTLIHNYLYEDWHMRTLVTAFDSCSIQGEHACLRCRADQCRGCADAPYLQSPISHACSQQLAGCVVGHCGHTNTRSTGGGGLHHSLLQDVVGVPDPAKQHNTES